MGLNIATFDLHVEFTDFIINTCDCSQAEAFTPFTYYIEVDESGAETLDYAGYFYNDDHLLLFGSEPINCDVVDVVASYDESRFV